MGGQADVDLLVRRVVCVVTRVHLRLGGVFVGGDEDHALRIVGVLEKTAEVVVEAELALLGLDALVVDVELGGVLEDRIAPGDEDGVIVALGQSDLVVGVHLDGLEPHALDRGRFPVRAGGGTGAGGRGGGGLIGRRAGGQGGGAADGDHGEAAGP